MNADSQTPGGVATGSTSTWKFPGRRARRPVEDHSKLSLAARSKTTGSRAPNERRLADAWRGGHGINIDLEIPRSSCPQARRRPLKVVARSTFEDDWESCTQRTPTRRRLEGWPRDQHRLGNSPVVVPAGPSKTTESCRSQHVRRRLGVVHPKNADSQTPGGVATGSTSTWKFPGRRALENIDSTKTGRVAREQAVSTVRY